MEWPGIGLYAKCPATILAHFIIIWQHILRDADNIDIYLFHLRLFDIFSVGLFFANYEKHYITQKLDTTSFQSESNKTHPQKISGLGFITN